MKRATGADDEETPDQLRRKLDASRSEVAALRSSLRFQIGDAIVTAMSGRATVHQRLKALKGGLDHAWALSLMGQIRNSIFCGLPNDGLPPPDVMPNRTELRRIIRYLKDLAEIPAAHGMPISTTSEWTSSAVRLGREFAQILERGYLLPDAIEHPRSLSARPRILYVSRHDPVDSTNGYARRTHHLTAALAGQGVDVTVAVVDGSDSVASAAGSISRIGLDAPNQSNGIVEYVERLAERIANAALQTQAEFIHAASNYLIGLAAMVAARKLSIRCVYEVRGLWEMTRASIDAGFTGTLGYKVQAKLETICADQADLVILSSSGLEQEFRLRGATRPKFHLALSGGPNLTDRERPRQSHWDTIFPPGSKTLGFFGSITSYEGFNTIIPALARLIEKDDSYRLLVLGDGPFLAKVKHLAGQAGLARAIHFAGRVSPDLVEDAYGAVALMLCPRDDTAVTRVVESLKPVESLAHGVPVAISVLPAFQHLLENCPGVIRITPGKPNDLEHKIEQFFAQQVEFRRRCGIDGQLWIRTNRSWEQSAKDVLSAYREL